MDQGLIQRYRDPSYKFSKKAKEDFLQDDVFAFVTIFFKIKGKAYASAKSNQKGFSYRSLHQLSKDAWINLQALSKSNTLAYKLVNYLQEIE